MARPRKLDDVKAVGEIIAAYKANPKPTLSGLARALKIHPDTLYRNMDREDDIGDLLMDAYLYMVEMHEEKLYEKGAVGSIFWLKCLKKYITFKDTPDESIKTPNLNFTYEIVDKTRRPHDEDV